MRFGKNLLALEHCGSTNDEARRLALSGAPDGTVVTALEQTKGRGRAGRSWHSPPGDGLYLSLISRLKIHPREAPRLSLVVGLAIAEAIDSLLPSEAPRAKLKWPNDVFLSQKKLAGVLLELSVKEDLCDFFIIGVGLNVNTQHFPEELRQTATSLSLEAKQRFDLSLVLRALLQSLERCIDELSQNGFYALRERWKARSYTLGQKVSASFEGKGIVGVAVDVDPDGALLIETDAGERITIIAGDVINLVKD